MDSDVTVFEALRPRLNGLAYRMLGRVPEAEDAVQDAYLRWQAAFEGRGQGEPIRSAEAFLVTVTTRLCLDRLRAARTERESYIGPWLPEPLVTGEEADPAWRLDRADDLSLAVMILLDRLAPDERAAFLLREVFEVGYAAIARTLGRSEAACRQLVHRARERVRTERSRQAPVDAAAHRALLERFLAATTAGDETALLALMAPDATFTSDGGGKVWAARKVIQGAARCARLLIGVARKTAPLRHRLIEANGAPAILSWRDGRLFSATAIDTDGTAIQAIFRVLNPDKLRAVTGKGHPAS